VGTSFRIRCAGSQALCVEYLGDSPQHVLWGHRDGSISLVDMRVPSLFQCVVPDDKGSVTGVKVLGNCAGTDTAHSPHAIIAKRSFGSCGVYDIRRMGGGASSNAATSRVWELSPVTIHETLSMYCTGLALDPTGSVVISPFVDHQRVVQFALWSLKNGQWIGNSVAGFTSHNKQEPKNDLPCCELCGTSTPTWSMTEKLERRVTIEHSSHMRSNWFKMGLDGEGKSPDCMGSIHQLSMRSSS